MEPTYVLLPSLLGTSKSYLERAARLRAGGKRVQTVDIYHRQAFGRPYVLWILLKDLVRKGAWDRLALAFDERIVMEEIGQNYLPGSPMILIGTSIGGVFALRYAEMHPQQVAGVVAISSHLVYPNIFPPERRPADPSRVQCPVLLIHGKQDVAITSATIPLAERLAKEHQHITTTVYEAGHSFTEEYIQDGLANRFWNRCEAEQAWQQVWNWVAKLPTD